MIKSYIACLIAMCSAKFSSLQDYFRKCVPTQDPRSCYFIRKRMVQDTFREIQNSLDFNIDFVEKMVSTIHNYYDHGTIVSSDETMAPTKSRDNPQHIYVPNKPHPNGILVKK